MRILARSGYDAEGAASAEEARERRSAGISQIIFLYIGMPGTDSTGTDVISLAREFRRHPRFRESRLVCVSGTSFDERSEAAALFDALLLKPVDRAMFIRTITGIVES